METEIINRVQNSSLITLNLEDYYVEGDRVFYDIKPLLFQETILKEKDFRASLKSIDWSAFKDKHVAIGCSVDAIIPTWAFMLLAISLKPFATTIIFGSLKDIETYLYRNSIATVDWSKYRLTKVVIKGCSKNEVPIEIYVEVASRLKEVATSIMYGEPCSTVPLYKAV